MNRRGFLSGFCSCCALTLSACVTDSLSKPAVPGQRLQPEAMPGYRPSLATDEGGLWDIMNRYEAELRTSRFLVRDRELNAYVKDVACKLARNYCPDVRVYVTRTPYFNASMAPNGMMQVWTGLLLRVQNEAQLAAILGHELGHYLRRHTIQQFRDARAKADFAAFLSMGLAMAGVGAAGNAVQLIMLASIFAYSRDHEREADSMGLELMADAGYDPGEASKVWQQLIEEMDAREHKTPREVVFASHPAPEERLGTLREEADTRKAQAPQASFDAFKARYRDTLRQQRRWMLRDEVRLRQFGPSLAMFDQLLRVDPADGDVLFAKGEVYRLRNDGDDPTRALETYDKALASSGAPAETHRSKGFVYQRQRDYPNARRAFERYLEVVPNADDRDAIRSYITQGGAGV